MSNQKVVEVLKKALADDPSRYALHNGYGLVKVTDKVGCEHWWGDAVGVSPIASDLLDVFKGEEGWKGDGIVDDDVSLGWNDPDPEMGVDFSIRYVHETELVPLSSLDEEIVKRILTGSRFLAYWDVFGEDEDVEPCKAANLSDILDGVYPVGIDVDGRVTTMPRKAKLYKFSEKWLPEKQTVEEEPASFPPKAQGTPLGVWISPHLAAKADLRSLAIMGAFLRWADAHGYELIFMDDDECEYEDELNGQERLVFLSIEPELPDVMENVMSAGRPVRNLALPDGQLWALEIMATNPVDGFEPSVDLAKWITLEGMIHHLADWLRIGATARSVLEYTPVKKPRPLQMPMCHA